VRRSAASRCSVSGARAQSEADQYRGPQSGRRCKSGIADQKRNVEKILSDAFAGMDDAFAGMDEALLKVVEANKVVLEKLTEAGASFDQSGIKKELKELEAFGEKFLDGIKAAARKASDPTKEQWTAILGNIQPGRTDGGARAETFETYVICSMSRSGNVWEAFVTASANSQTASHVAILPCSSVAQFCSRCAISCPRCSTAAAPARTARSRSAISSSRSSASPRRRSICRETRNV